MKAVDRGSTREERREVEGARSLVKQVLYFVNKK